MQTQSRGEEEQAVVGENTMSCWQLVSASGEDFSHAGVRSQVVTLCDFKGRQVWRYDASKQGSAAELEAEKARETFTKNKRTKRHSDDALLRIQRIEEKGFAPALIRKKKRKEIAEPERVVSAAKRRGTAAAAVSSSPPSAKKTESSSKSRSKKETAAAATAATAAAAGNMNHDEQMSADENNEDEAMVVKNTKKRGITTALRRLTARRKGHASKEEARKRSGDANDNDIDDHDDDEEVDAEAVSIDQVEMSLRDGLGFFEMLQCEDGHFPGDYGGPLFLMPGLLIVLYMTGEMDQVLSEHHKKEILRYLLNHQRADGGYGLHIEGERSTMFGTVLSYVSMRLLGLDASHDAITRARSWIIEGGGAVMIPSWGKFWLCVLGVYDWSGLNPMPPEMWLLPYAGNPLHPGRFWCHCRMVYLPMSYVYGKRGTAAPSQLTSDIKSEIHVGDYDSIDWDKSRNQCHANDLYYPHPLIQDCVWYLLHRAEPLLLPGGSFHWLRRRALREAMTHIQYEDVNTRYVDIGPVNKVLNMLCCWLDDDNTKSAEAFRMHLPRIMDYLWVAEDGMKMQGYNGSQLWDTAFAVQALEASGLAHEFKTMAIKMQDYVDATQVRENCPSPLGRYYRHISKGAWPFSTRDHGWPITDCSSEGLKAAMFLNQLEDYVTPGSDGSVKKMVRIPDERLFDCVNVILSFQNGNGGWATYENTRSFRAVEILNPAETFGDIMIDYSYVECSTACITALSKFTKRYPSHRQKEIKRALKKGKAFILNEQRADGSWYGSWGVCFTYAIWFGCESLHALGEKRETCSALRRASAFLLEKQRPDGGWGESYLSCQDKEYSQLPEDEPSHVVNTAWAMLGLMYAGQHTVDTAPLHRAARFLISMQEEDGDWPQQHISGVFNRNCMITYANYRNIFPIWALGEYRKHCAAA